MGIKHNLSTAFHPQTDGQTERSNQSLEAYLRHYVNHAQDNWVALLPMAQVALNNNASETTKETPFFANYGKNPNLFMEGRLGPRADKALHSVQELRKVHECLRLNTARSQNLLSASRHKDSKTAPQLNKGDKVYLLTKNLKTRRKTKKLDHVKVGPFLIQEVKGKNNYQLDLPSDARIHKVFHVSLLEPADPGTPVQTTFHYEPQEDDIFEVESIEEFNGDKYRVRWKDYDRSEDTWEPPENLTTCLKLLQDFHHRVETTDALKELELSFRIRAGHWHVDTTTSRKFLGSFPLKEYNSRNCPICRGKDISKQSHDPDRGRRQIP
jgi:hypothetical protein